MKTKKMKSTLLGVTLLAVATLLASGCTKPNNENGNDNNGNGGYSGITQLSGFWAAAPSYDSYHECNFRYPVLEFVNSNTVIEYTNVFDDYVSVLSTNDFPNHSGWYYGSKTTLTYAFSDNKVILTNGDIYTFMDGKLYKDNSSKVLSSWQSGSNSGNGNLSPQDEELTNKLKNTTWRFVKKVTYHFNTGTTTADSNAYGTVSFRNSFDGTSNTARVLTVNGNPLGIWYFNNGELKIGISSDHYGDAEGGILLMNICMGGTIEQLTYSTLVTVKSYETHRETFYYTSE